MNWNNQRIAILGLGLLILTAGLIGAGENLLKNGDFEGKDENGIPEGWTKFVGYDYNNQLVYSMDKEEKHGGVQSLRFMAEKNPGSLGVEQRIKVTPGKKYSLSLWVKGKSLKNLSDGEAVIISYPFLDTNGKAVAAEGRSAEELRVLRKGGEWIQRQYQLQAPAGASELAVRLMMYEGTGTVWFDDIVLKESAAP